MKENKLSSLEGKFDSLWVYGVIGILLLFLLFGPTHWYNRWTYPQSLKDSSLTACENASIASFGVPRVKVCECFLNEIMNNRPYDKNNPPSEATSNQFIEDCTKQYQ